MIDDGDPMAAIVELRHFSAPVRYTGPDDATENIESISIEEAEALETWVSNITVQPGNGRLGVA